MAFRSEAQRRKFAELVKTGKITPGKFEEWNQATKGKLPERVTNTPANSAISPKWKKFKK